MSMRIWFLASVVAASMATTASAQQPASSFFTGVPATQIKNIPMDTSRAVIQHPAQAALTNNRFNFTALFNKLTLPTWPPKRGVSPLPSPNSFPTYENFKHVGKAPYPIKYMFGDKSPIQPAVPFIPSSKTPVGPGSN